MLVFPGSFSSCVKHNSCLEEINISISFPFLLTWSSILPISYIFVHSSILSSSLGSILLDQCYMKGTEYMLQEHKSIRTPDNGVNHLFHYLCHDRSDIQVCWLCWKKENIIIIGMSGFLENWNVWTIGVQMVSHPYICSNLKNEQE